MIKHRICILLNKSEEYDFEDLLHQYLPTKKFDVQIMDCFPKNPSDFQVIIPWNYQKVIKQTEKIKNIFVMHSSKLPEGRGWAPIYYAFKEKQSVYFISVIIAVDKVDQGDIIIQASFPIESDYTATFIRKLDEEISLLLISKLFDKWPDGKAKGIKQTGKGSYRKRRNPRENQININESIENLLPHLRGVESKHPAYFYYDNIKYNISISPEKKADFPKEVTIEYPYLNKIEIWRKKGID